MLDSIELSRGILYFPNAISDHKKLIENINSANDDLVSDWKSWSGHNDDVNPPYGIRKYVTGETSKSNNYESQYVLNTIYNAMISCAEVYKEKYKIDIPIKVGKSFVINEYIDGGFMGSHVDYNEFNTQLAYSFVVYLNADYDGGEIFFVNQQVKQKPDAGSIIIFPSDEPYQHSSLKNYNGKKMFIPHFWTKGE